MTTRLIGTVMPNPEPSDAVATYISAEAADYDEAKAELEAQIPEGHRLIAIRRET